MAVVVSNPPWWTQVDDALLADRPLLVGEHLIFEQRSIIQPGFHGFWSDTHTYSASAPGGSRNRNPATSFDPTVINSYFRLFDKQHDLAFSPELTVSEADLYLWGDIDPDDGKFVDVVVLGYNFVGISFDVTVNVSLMNYRDQASVTGTLASRTIAGTDPRQGLIYIALPNQYKNVGGYRIHFDPGASTFGPGVFPGITEAVLGRRCQLGVQPVRPYSLDRYEADVDQFFAESGQAWNVVRHVGRWEQDVVFEFEARGNRYGWSDVDRVRELGIVTGGFSEPFAVFPAPHSDAARGHWTQAVPPALRLPETAPGRREWSMTWREIPPDYRVRATKVGQFVPSAGAAPWSPLDLSPVAWWDGTDASTMNTAVDGSGTAPASGDNVARWVDKVGAYVAEDPASTAPVFRGSVDAEGVDKLVVTGSDVAFDFLHDGSGGSVFFRGRFDVDNSARLLFDGSNFATSGPGLVLFRRANNVLAAIVTNAVASAVVTVDSAPVTAADGTFDAVVSVNAGGVSLWLNGVEYTAARSGAYAAGDAGFPYSMFNRSSGVGFGFDGRCQHIVVVDAEATAEDVSNWGAWA